MTKNRFSKFYHFERLEKILESFFITCIYSRENLKKKHSKKGQYKKEKMNYDGKHLKFYQFEVKTEDSVCRHHVCLLYAGW
jgi:hypothetical protein